MSAYLWKTSVRSSDSNLRPRTASCCRSSVGLTSERHSRSRSPNASIKLKSYLSAKLIFITSTSFSSPINSTKHSSKKISSALGKSSLFFYSDFFVFFVEDFLDFGVFELFEDRALRLALRKTERGTCCFYFFFEDNSTKSLTLFHRSSCSVLSCCLFSFPN